MKRNQPNTIWMLDSTQHVNSHPDVRPKKKSEFDICPFIWSWDIIVQENGDVVVTLHQYEKASKNSDCSIDFFYTNSEIVSALKKNKCSSPFAQIALEGKISKRIKRMEDALANHYSMLHNGHNKNGIIIYKLLKDAGRCDYTINDIDIIGNVYVKDIVLAIAWNRALMEVFHSSIAYDSPYGGGKDSIYNLLDFPGTIASSPSTP